jgi:glycosyltransferase involved in cell wall biosynthesis
MKIAATFHSNAPWAATGYGTQTKQLVSRMVADGHAIAVAANYGLEATITEWDGITVYPRGYDVWNNDVVGPYFDEWSLQHPGYKAMQFTLFDVWVLNSPRFDDIPTASWVPVDHLPAPPAVVDFLKKPTVTPIAMSKFGRDMIRNADLDCEYVPHGIETKVFKPTARVDIGGRRMTGREIMGIDESAYVVGAFNANKGTSPSRKAWAENILAFSIFARNHSDAVLYLHTDRHGAMGGLKLDELVRSVGLEERQYRFVNQWAYRTGIPQEGVAALMTATDVGLLPTMGEGFGLTAVEMQATGTKVIVNNFSAQPELVGDGYLVEGQPWWDASQRAWFNLPMVGSIVEQLEAAYAAGRGRSQKAIDFVVKNYDADVVYNDLWRPVLDRLAA